MTPDTVKTATKITQIDFSLKREIDGTKLKIRSDLNFSSLRNERNGPYILGGQYVYMPNDDFNCFANQHNIVAYLDQNNKLFSQNGAVNVAFLLAQNSLKDGVIFNLDDFPYSKKIKEDFSEKFKAAVKCIYENLLKTIKFEVTVFES